MELQPERSGRTEGVQRAFLGVPAPSFPCAHLSDSGDLCHQEKQGSGALLSAACTRSVAQGTQPASSAVLMGAALPEARGCSLGEHQGGAWRSTGWCRLRGLPAWMCVGRLPSHGCQAWTPVGWGCPPAWLENALVGGGQRVERVSLISHDPRRGEKSSL